MSPFGVFSARRGHQVAACVLFLSAICMRPVDVWGAQYPQYACGTYVPPQSFPAQQLFFGGVWYSTPGGACAASIAGWQALFPQYHFSGYVIPGSSCACQVTIEEGGNWHQDNICIDASGLIKVVCPAGYQLQTDNITCGPGTPAPPPLCPTDGSPDPFASAGSGSGATPPTTGTRDPTPQACDPIMVANPINAKTGNKYQQEVDYIGAGAFPLVFVRHYNSGIVNRPSLGPQWRHHYDRQILVEDATHVAVVRPGGSAFEFALANSVWTSTTDLVDKLQQVGGGWQLTTSVDEVETYNSAGLLTSISNRAGLLQVLTYSDTSTSLFIAPKAGLLLRVTDPAGRHLDFVYDGSSRIKTMTDPGGQLYQFSYGPTSANGDPAPLASVTYPGSTPNPVRSYSYAGGSNPKLTNALTGIQDENGQSFATFSYDNTTGQAIGSSHGGSVGADPYTLTYNANGTTSVADANISRTYSFQTALGVAKVLGVGQPCDACGSSAVAGRTYDANGNIATATDFNGNRTNYGYDLTRNLQTQRIEGLTSGGATTSVTRTISTQWHATFRLPLKIAEPKRITTLAYDAQGNLTSKSIQATTDTNGSQGFNGVPTGSPRAWTYTSTYSSTLPGLMVQQVVDGPRTDVSDLTTYAWDNSGNLNTVTNALGHATNLGSYDAHGRPQLITDPNGRVTSLGYDPRGRVTTTNTAGELTGYTYDGVGQLTKITMPDSSYLSYTYDAAHRLTQIQDNLNNKILYTLDAMGNRTQEQIKDPSNILVQTRSRTYNSLNRLVQDIGGASPATEITTYGYDNQGNLTAITDPLTHLTTNVYDALNRLIKGIDPAASGSGQGGNTQYAFDGLDQITQVTDPRSLATSYTMDGLGNLSQQVSPDAGTTIRTYDAAGNLKTSTDARAVVATFTYDALNRLTQAVYAPPPGITAATLGYTYDQGTYGKGRLTGFTDPTGSTGYAYNQKGRLTQETRVISGVTYTTAYGYDGFGRLSSINYPGGRVVSYTRDSAGRISQIATTPSGGSAQTVVSNVTYQPLGGVKGWSFGNGTYTRTYDLDGRIAGHPLANLNRTITYDAASRITGFTHNNSAYNQTFGYDNLNRATSWVASNTNQSYGYDVVHNRTSITIGASTYTYAYPANKNRLSSVSGPLYPRNYTYDADGNTTYDGGPNQYQYDARGRLIRDQHFMTIVGYALNGLGQRVQKTPVPGAATVFHYDKDGRLIAESTATGTVIREYFYLNDTPVAVATSQQAGGLYFIEPDHVDTPRVIVNNAGTVAWRWDNADPFGSALPNSNPSGLGAFTFNLRFPGQYFDPETQLHYNYFRDYDPSTGRYIESDPIGLDGGFNTYSYGGNNPLTYVDPLGLDVTIEIYRYTYGPTSVQGTIDVRSNLVPASFFGSSLEARYAGRARNKNPIPEGDYVGKVRTDGPKGPRVELQNVTGYDNIQIHRGNTSEDVIGCTVPGTSNKEGKVNFSADAMKQIMDIIRRDATGNIVVKVRGSPTPISNIGQ